MKLPTQAEVEAAAAEFKVDVRHFLGSELQERMADFQVFVNTLAQSPSFHRMLHDCGATNPHAAASLIIMACFGYRLRESMLELGAVEELERMMK